VIDVEKEEDDQKEKRAPEELAAILVGKAKRREPLDPHLIFALVFGILERDELTELALDVILGCADHEQDYLELAVRTLEEAVSDLGREDDASIE
jgi:hypothetical protein